MDRSDPLSGTDRPGPRIEVPAARLFEDWREARHRAFSYLEALGIEAERREELVAAAVERAIQREPQASRGGAVADTLAALRDLVGELPSEGSEEPSWPGVSRFTRWCLGRILGGATRVPVPERQGVPTSLARLARGSMVPEKFERRFFVRLFQRLMGRTGPGVPRGAELRRQRGELPWVWPMRRRRILLLVLVLIPSWIASSFMQEVLPHQGRTWIEFFIVLFFGALFGWISIGFWTATLGFLTLLRGDRFAVTNLPPIEGGRLQPEGRTAVVMPICEEPVERVFAGLRAIHDSLQATGAGKHFDFFILSDSHDPATWVREEEAWAAWCRETGGFGRIFYRRRKVRLKRKSGNVADFCRRWGRAYRYMIMLDADSVMQGETLVRMVQMMESHPTVGMIQTAPTAVNRRSLLARVQQFTSRVYGPMFAAGLHWWQLGDGQYWGHNAILRIAPFMEHCALPKLPGKPPLGGEILSHDFVEAALLGRAGWQIWLAYDLPGSFEEVPSTLLEEMNRDRRWCQGNLQHLRLLFTEGLFGAHRVLFLNGVLSYVSALLWFAFLTLSTIEAVADVIWEPEYFPDATSLFPEWPVWRPDWALALMAVTAVILFLPKILSLFLLIVVRRRAAEYGGVPRLLGSALLEIVMSSLLAPIRMVFHSRFVVQNLMGRTVQWTSQGREDAETRWRDALRYHGADTLFASAWGYGLYTLNPNYFWWLTPIIAALFLSIPLSVYASRVRPGEITRRLGLFLIPEESGPPTELRSLDERLEEAESRREARVEPLRDGFVRAIVDPQANALRQVLAGPFRRHRASIRAERRGWAERLLAEGPEALPVRSRRLLLGDAALVAELHERVWALEDRATAARWGIGV